MNKFLTILLLSAAAGNCVATVSVNRKIKIEKTDKGIELRLADANRKFKYSSKVVIAVIDTGFDYTYKKDVKLCKTGHKSFVPGIESTDDDHGHGTHIAGLIAKNAKTDYCLMILKYYSPKVRGSNNLLQTIQAFRWAIDNDVDMINYSGGGLEPSETEKELILEALDKNIVIVAAAGNEGSDFRKQGFYPAMYDKRIIVVGNLAMKKGKVIRAPSSNYGDEVDVQVFGTNVESLNGKMTGTSQATAIVTGRIAEHVGSFRANEAVKRFYDQNADSYYSPISKYME